MLHLAILQVHAAVTEHLHALHVVADEEHRPAAAGHVFHFSQAFALEFRVAYGKYFVHDEDLTLQVRRDCES